MTRLLDKLLALLGIPPAGPEFEEYLEALIAESFE